MLSRWLGRLVRWDRAALLAAAAAAAAGFALVYLVAVRTPAGQWFDDAVFGHAQAQLPGPANGMLSTLARVAAPAVLAGAVAVEGVLAVVRRDWRGLGAAAVTLGLSVAAAAAAQALLSRPDLGQAGYPQNTLPSGHVVVVTALAAAAVLLWPRPRPPWVRATALVVAALAGIGNVTDLAHRPADVVAAWLLVASAAALGSAATLPGP